MAASFASQRSQALTFERDGYLGPVAVLDRSECRALAAYLARGDLPQPPVWEKARAVRERALFDVAVRPEVLGPVVEILGTDVVLWGVTAVTREPGRSHPWHSDIESSGPSGGFVSVWIGIENTSRDSSLELLPGSHRYGRTVQEARAARRIHRDDGTAASVLEIAREHDAGAQVLVPDMADGEAVFFDGRLWHGTDNTSGDTRTALLVQFAAADRPVRIPDWSELDWPFRFRPEQPEVLLVHGTGSGSTHRLVSPPPVLAAGRSRFGTIVHTFALPVDAGRREPWQPFPAFSGPTPVLSDMACHASVLDAGHSPHPPHAHDEEEILVALHGEAELVIAESPSDPSPRVEHLRPGSFVYYPAGQHHTIRNPGGAPVGYLMLKWRAPTVRSRTALATEVVHVESGSPGDAAPFSTRVLLEAATGCLDTLHCHLSVLAPGAGYESHRDDYDVAIVTLEGTVATVGRRVPPGSVVYFAAGELHGMRNVGRGLARYLVFELHRSSRFADRLRRAFPRG
jgi:mannose-6-phosphate isomerase-like protein (cupin superfamily)